MLKFKNTVMLTPAIGAVALAEMTASAWAGAPVGVPVPLAGVGLPALAAGACGYWIYRKIRDRSRSD